MAVLAVRVLLPLLAALGVAQTLGAPTPTFPKWVGPTLNPLRPHGGVPLAANVTHFQIFRATKELGTYNMSPMMDYHAGQFLVSWKNSPEDEDQPGQRILYSQSLDGVHWTPTDGTNILFPNMSTNANPAALFAEPVVHINGRFYAAASPHQFCLYPIQSQVPDGLGMSTLLLRQILVPGVGKFGPIFWATKTIPPGFEPASQALNIVTVDKMDSQTQADVAFLANPNNLPCGPTSAGSLKCEACIGSCQTAQFPNMTNELTHYIVPGGQAEVVFHRIPHTEKLRLAASVRFGKGNWSTPTLTNFPDDHANLNAGPLPDGRNYLLSNAMPNLMRDPLFISTTTDGWNWYTLTALTTCEEEIYTAPDQPWGCLFRYKGGAKQSGIQYPQGMSLTAPGVAGFWAVASLNKEDIWVYRTPFSSIL